jgi:hypothetical protein
MDLHDADCRVLAPVLRIFTIMLILLYFSKETLRSIAECSNNDIIKLYNHKGFLLNISSKLDANSKKEFYRLEVVVKSLGKPNTSIVPFGLIKNLFLLLKRNEH